MVRTVGTASPSAAGHSVPWLLATFVLVSRLPLESDCLWLWKDGPAYVASLDLPRTFVTPMPGNLGFVVAARLAQTLVGSGAEAYALVEALLSVAAVVMAWRLALRFVTPALAGAYALALACQPLVWWFGVAINCYLVWLVVPLTVSVIGLRFLDERRLRDAALLGAALGLGSALRPDQVAFAGPLVAAFLLLGRGRLRHWLIAAAAATPLVAAWFFGTATLVGGPGAYLELVRARHVYHETFSPSQAGLVEGLARNGLKYAAYLAWSCHLALVPFALGAWRGLRAPRCHGRHVVLAVLAVAPTAWFANGVFAGTPALVLPAVALVLLVATRTLSDLAGPRSRRWALAAVLALAALGALQFLASPLLPERDVRGVVANVTFQKYTAAGLERGYYYNLTDHGLDPSLAAVLTAVRRDLAAPRRPPRCAPVGGMPTPALPFQHVAERPTEHRLRETLAHEAAAGRAP